MFIRIYILYIIYSFGSRNAMHTDISGKQPKQKRNAIVGQQNIF